MMRAMCGSDFNLTADDAIMNGMLALLRDDGLLYMPPDDEWPGAYAFTNARMMIAMMAWYQRDRSQVWLDRIGKVAAAFARMAIYREDYAYYPPEAGYSSDTGWTFTRRHGTPYFRYTPPDEPTRDQQGIEGMVRGEQGNQIRALARWYMWTGDEQALEVAHKVTNFVLKPDFYEPGHPIDIIGPEHGHFAGHFHGNGIALRGILEYALATKNQRLLQFVRDGYTYARSFGIARMGWFPGSVYPESHGRPQHFALRAEGCGLANMVALGIGLTDAGLGDFWDDVDQLVRNQLVEQQVTRTDLMAKASAASPERQVSGPNETADVPVLDIAVGSFTDWAGLTHIGLPEGCCTANCTQALFYAWESIVRGKEGVAQVNLLLNRASSWLDVDSYLPYEGKVVLHNKTARKAYVRIPSWVDKAAVRCRIGQSEVQPGWLGNYLIFDSLSPRSAITIEFPMVEATETYRVRDTSYSLKLKGNTLVDISPRDQRPTIYPIYLRDQYWADRAPLKAVTRYVAPFAIRW
jgi:hypothetical protein